MLAWVRHAFGPGHKKASLKVHVALNLSIILIFFAKRVNKVSECFGRLVWVYKTIYGAASLLSTFPITAGLTKLFSVLVLFANTVSW